MLDVPVLGATVRGLTRKPRTEPVEIDGVPVEIVRPGGRGPWPAWVFVTGAHPLRRREPIVQRLAHGLARAGYVALVPDLPGLGEGELTERTLPNPPAPALFGHQEARALIRALASLRGRAGRSRVGARESVEGTA